MVNYWSQHCEKATLAVYTFVCLYRPITLPIVARPGYNKLL